jgi:hypothetical protein
MREWIWIRGGQQLTALFRLRRRQACAGTDSGRRAVEHPMSGKLVEAVKPDADSPLPFRQWETHTGHQWHTVKVGSLAL